MIDGGAAILAAAKINHQKDIAGKRERRPLVRNNLRVCVISYVIFARANRQEEQIPWAIIISKLPWKPQYEPDIRPAVKSPI